MAKVGDMVRFLSSTGGGRVIKIDGNIAHVEEDDGFVTPVLAKELVVVAAAGDAGMRRDAFGGTEQARKVAEAEKAAKGVVTVIKDEAMPKEEPAYRHEAVEETTHGDIMNVTLAFAAMELKHLSTTNYEAYLVNDSNYYIYFTFLSKSDDDSGWSTRFAGMVEPNMQVFLEELTREQVGRLDRLAFQFIAFKQSKEFKLKAPVAIEVPMDTTKFFKLHCFHASPYFDEPVISVDIVRNDIPQRPMTIDSAGMQEALRLKRNADRQRPRPVEHRKINKNEPMVVDLHINELLDSTAGMSPSEILNYQVDTFRRVMDENLRFHGKKIVFIHGKGEGVLRQALSKELSHRYRGHDVQDASFREYGYGATQVTIR